MITLNAAHFAASKPSSSVARIKCPVEETGRNSVTPSTMPRMMAMSSVDMEGRSLRRRPRAGTPGEAVAREAAQPFGADRGERSRRDCEGIEAGQLARNHVVALEHQPLVTGQWRTRQEAETRQQASGDVG